MWCVWTHLLQREGYSLRSRLHLPILLVLVELLMSLPLAVEKEQARLADVDKHHVFPLPDGEAPVLAQLPSAARVRRRQAEALPLCISRRHRSRAPLPHPRLLSFGSAISLCCSDAAK